MKKMKLIKLIISAMELTLEATQNFLLIFRKQYFRNGRKVHANIIYAFVFESSHYMLNAT